MGEWNHNIHYHDLVLGAVPVNCQRALDVGCGQGLLARQLAQKCTKVFAMDIDDDTLARARSDSRSSAPIEFVHGDVMMYAFEPASFDVITAVATLHHLPLRPALDRFRELLKPGGTLAVIGLYRPETIQDDAFAAMAFPTSCVLRWRRGNANVGAPMQEPRETLSEIRTACDSVLPGGIFRRHLLFRYSFIWTKRQP
jgi:2-polyprenyl-3-methyl-5-hydroxy-6-metoxy-1,4-benzoquinol methylase